MISQKMTDAVNDQIKAEFDSAYLYLAMSAYLEGKNLKGMAHWLKEQFKEEQGHACKLMEHLYERGAKVTLEALAKPDAKFGSPAEVFQTVAKHERKVSERIDRLMDLAKKENDYASQAMLTWFVSEQVDEEAGADDIVSKFELLGDSPVNVYMLDKELAQR